MIAGLDIRFQSCSEPTSGSTTERWHFSPDWMDFLRVLARYVASDIESTTRSLWITSCHLSGV